MTRPILGIAGYKGSGKSTAAKELHAIGFQNIKFAGPLKDMLRVLGLTDEHLEGKLKEERCELLNGRTPRYAMKTLGAEWGREMIQDSLWIDTWKRKVDLQPPWLPICCDDVRYPNEVVAIQAMGGKILMIDRAHKQTDTHSSEDISHIDPDFTIYNTADIETFQTQVRNLGLNLKNYG